MASARHSEPTRTAGKDPLSLPFVQTVLSDLVRTPSVNPGVPELAMAERVTAWMEPTGARIHTVDTFAGRPSVAAVLEGGRGGGTTLVLNGHMDTVAVDDLDRWTSDPFSADVRNGFLYGRGACDMKGGLAAQIAVAHELAPRLDELSGSLVLHFAAGEERGEPGTLSLCQAGFVGDVGIVTEPTQLEVSVATRGLVAVRIRILGQSTHASTPSAGRNPLDHLGDVLRELDAHARDVAGRRHELLGSGSCTPTVVHGGVKENAIADYCDLFVDRRLIPGESPVDAVAAIRACLERISVSSPDFEYELDHAPYPFEPAEVAREAALAATVRDAASNLLGRPVDVIGTAYSSDVRNLVNDAGMEAVTFGPGHVAECHCVDERVALDQVRDAARVLSRVAFDLLA
jgi:succinyl-diaminopimelate desuccinylase